MSNNRINTLQKRGVADIVDTIKEFVKIGRIHLNVLGTEN